MARALQALNHDGTRMPLRHRLWRPTRDLASLTSRAQRIGEQMGPLTEVPALVRIENEHWIFERIEASTLHQLTHRLVLQTDQGEEVLGVTENFATALEVALHGGERPAGRTDSAVVNSEQVHDCLNHALVDQVKEATSRIQAR